MGAKKKAGGKSKGGKGKKEKKPKDAVGEAVNEVEEAERKVQEKADFHNPGLFPKLLIITKP